MIEPWLAELVGVRFKHGGRSPEEGFDCATLCTWIQRRRGLVEFPWNPFHWRRYAHWIDRKESLQQFDALFYAPIVKGIAVHVAVVVDNFNVIHSSEDARSVVLSKIDNAPFTKAARFLSR